MQHSAPPPQRTRVAHSKEVQPLATTHDVIVVGLGAHGSAVACELARRGYRVVGIEAFGRAHPLGSSGGLTRIIRTAYWEQPRYVPLLLRSWSLWRELEAETGVRLLTQTGGLYVGPRDGAQFAGALASARTHGLQHVLLDEKELRDGWPMFSTDPGSVGIFDELAGVLSADRAISAALDLAQRAGAELRFDERVREWALDGDGVIVRTDRGRHVAGRLVIAAGPWTAKLLPELESILSVERVPMFWFQPSDMRTLAGRELPIYLIDTGSFDGQFYGFPHVPGQGLKIARHHSGVPADPDALDRTTTRDEEDRIRRFVQRYMPWVDGPLMQAVVCMYTNTPDGHFMIGTYRADARVVFASACSGHGFKFAPVIGEMLADLTISGTTAHDVSFLLSDRFVAARASGASRTSLEWRAG